MAELGEVLRAARRARSLAECGWHDSEPIMDLVERAEVNLALALQEAGEAEHYTTSTARGFDSALAVAVAANQYKDPWRDL